jgi:hypothetical protein
MTGFLTHPSLAQTYPGKTTMDVEENQPETLLWYREAVGYRKRIFGSVKGGFRGELKMDSGLGRKTKGRFPKRFYDIHLPSFGGCHPTLVGMTQAVTVALR